MEKTLGKKSIRNTRYQKRRLIGPVRNSPHQKDSNNRGQIANTMKTREKFEQFRIRIKQKDRNNERFLQFSVKIKKAGNIKNKLNYFESGRQVYKQISAKQCKSNINQETYHQSEVNSHSPINENRIIKIRQPQFIQSNRFLQFFSQRNYMYQFPKKLSFMNLPQIFNEAYQRRIIQKSVYYRFLLHYSDQIENDYLQKIKGDAQKLNFKGCLFFLIDHRMITTILIDKFPGDYQMVTDVTTFSKLANQYLKEIYSLSKKQYVERLKLFNYQYDRFWMPNPQKSMNSHTVNLKYQDNIVELDKMNSSGRIMRRKY